MNLLISNSLFIGKVANFLPSVDSTNAFALNLMSKSSPIEGTVIYTDNQYAGRGQIGSKWESQAGKNIIMSVILYPNFLPVLQQFKLNQMVCLALYDLLFPLLSTPEILKVKWPNDVFIRDKKVAGVLIENKLQGGQIAQSVIGIGLNVNQDSFPDELNKATSLINETAGKSDRMNLMGRFCELLEFRYLQLKTSRNSGINKEYLNILYGFQQWRDFKNVASQKIFRGKISGIDPSGKLIINTVNASLSFSFKEVEFL
jgi:BirA family transcriptional regulator, biotin operon repressor / biotin---[acetyl-CoA-carboxylase] ligase